MAALTQDRDTPFKYKERKVVLDVAASTEIFNGSLVAVTGAGGFAVPAADTAGLVVIGRAEEYVDNSAGGDADKSVTVSKGVFKWANSSGTPVVQASVGDNAEVEDDQTVAVVGGPTNAVVAGTVEEIDDDGGIWVATL